MWTALTVIVWSIAIALICGLAFVTAAVVVGAINTIKQARKQDEKPAPTGAVPTWKQVTDGKE